MRRDDDAEEMILGEFDVPRTWMPAGELSLITAAVFLVVGVIAWLR